MPRGSKYNRPRVVGPGKLDHDQMIMFSGYKIIDFHETDLAFGVKIIL